MSGQGSGSISRYSFERQLLDQWGLWARAGGIDSGFSRVDLLKKGGLSLIFGDQWLIEADKTIAGLCEEHKRAIKRIFLSRKGNTIPQRERENAITAFAHAFEFRDI